MVSFGDISIVFIIILYNDYVYSVSLSPPIITDLGDLNFEASWEPLENYTGMYNLTRQFGEKNLCYTNTTSCFLGEKLLEDETCPLIQHLAVTLEADGNEANTYFSNNIFRVGPPYILSSDIDSTNITIRVQGAQTPLYYDSSGPACRGKSWKGEKSPIYTGQREAKHRVLCDFNLTDFTGSEASYELKNFYDGELSEIDGRRNIFLHKLKPFANYSISIWCTINNHDGPSRVYNFTTKEDVPSSGPSIVKPSSEGLGCDKPDLRNITFTIQPPPLDQRHGVLQLYEISYRIVTTNQEEEWQSEILELPSPTPDSTEVTLEDISRWDAYEVRVFANNSVGGMSSSVHQFEVLKSKQLQSRPQNMTTKEIKPGIWLLKWDHPWSPHTGDCIIDYVISTRERSLGTANTTSYELDTNAVGPVYTVKVTPMIYNGTGPAFEVSEPSSAYVYLVSLSPPTITDLGDLNFEASWEPLKNYKGMYNLTREFGEKNLCYTNTTSCFLGGKLLEDETCPLIQHLAVTLEAEGIEVNNFVSNIIFRVGPPKILSSDIDSTNITIRVQGAQTPLYYDSSGPACRGKSWKGEKSPIYTGQREAKHRVLCDFNLTNFTGSEVSYELKNFYDGELSEIDGRRNIFLHKLKPFANYSISIWCTINNHDGPSRVYNFTTKEEAPSSGPSIVKPSSEGLGCDKPDLRNITFTIQPPPLDQRHGVLQLYEISYRIVTTNQEEEWQSEILELPSPTPDSTEVTLEDISRWDAYEVRVFANNSVGGMSSSVHQFEVLKSKQVQSRPQNMTTKEIKPGIWLLKWDHPWSPHTGDCIIHYVISTGERSLGTTNTTSYELDTNAVGLVYTVKVTPMTYNGTGPAFKGSVLSSELMSRSALGLGKDLIIIVSVLLAVFVLLLLGCAYLCVQHGPRWTQPFDISNNYVLKAAFAMGDIRPKIPEREEYDTVVGVPPPPPPPPPFDDDDGEETETIALIETPPAGRAGGDAVPRPPAPDQSPPHSTSGSLSEECDPVVAMETDVGVMVSVQPSGRKLIIGCYEDSLGAISSYPSLTDSGYVQSPPPQMQPISNPAKPAEDSGYFRFDAFTNIPRSISLDNGKHHPGGDADERSCVRKDAALPCLSKYTDSGYVAGTITPKSSASAYPETTPFQGKYSMMKAVTRKQSSVDSEDTATSGSLSPSDSEMGDGVGSYTKLSQPNTPLSPRSKAKPGDDLQLGWDIERDLNSIQYLLHQLNDQVQHPGLSNVG